MYFIKQIPRLVDFLIFPIRKHENIVLFCGTYPTLYFVYKMSSR